jgi:hypothetical protein
MSRHRFIGVIALKSYIEGAFNNIFYSSRPTGRIRGRMISTAALSVGRVLVRFITPERRKVAALSRVAGKNA